MVKIKIEREALREALSKKVSLELLLKNIMTSSGSIWVKHYEPTCSLAFVCSFMHFLHGQTLHENV